MAQPGDAGLIAGPAPAEGAAQRLPADMKGAEVAPRP